MVRRHYFFINRSRSFYNENSKKNYGGFTAVYNNFGGKLFCLYGETNTVRKHGFGGGL